MTEKVIGALTIGQSPRPDLVGPLNDRLPEGCQIIQAGALDGLTAASLPPIDDTTYPLTTRMRDGSLVMVEESFLATRLRCYETLAHPLEERARKDLEAFRKTALPAIEVTP